MTSQHRSMQDGYVLLWSTDPKSRTVVMGRFTPGEVNRLERLRLRWSPTRDTLPEVDPNRLAYARYLEQTGRLEEGEFGPTDPTPNPPPAGPGDP